jgi:hypothetical protein
MKSKPFVIKSDQSGQALEPISPDRKLFTEAWLQKLLQQYPDLLPVDEIDPIFSSLVPIGREIATAVGFIDNLFISKAGYPIIVETKLWRNPEAKRVVLAQTIDYASELSKWSFDQFDNEVRKKNHKGVIELIQTTLDLDLDEVPTEDLIAKNLRLGRFLVLIVGDQIRSSLIDMLNYVNRYPHLATNVGLIELQCYWMPDHQGDMVIVPAVVAKTVIIERSIVQVNITPDVAHTLSVEQIKSRPENEGGAALSEDAFWEALKQKSPVSVASAKKIWDHFGKETNIKLIMRKTAVVARMDIPESDQRISLFFISTDGTLTCWPTTIETQLANAGLSKGLGVEYTNELSKLLKHRGGVLSIFEPIDHVDVNKFIAVVDNFIGKVLNAGVKTEE